MRRLKWISLVLWGASLTASGQATATISGKLVPELINTPIPTAYVTALKSGLPPASRTVLAGTNGSFVIPGLPAGTYSICFQAAGFLNPCEWNMATLMVTVAAGESSTGNALTLKPGSLTKLRVDDPSQLLAAKTKDGRPTHVLAGVWSGTTSVVLTPVASKAVLPSFPTQFHPMRMAAQDAAGADYEVLIPHNTPLSFHVDSPDFVLADSTGSLLANNSAQVTFQHSSTDPAPASFHYKIASRKP